ncbi:MAG: hypothetical protein V1887_03580 [Candidatus Aenigmatarchaeota archaeon]
MMMGFGSWARFLIGIVLSVEIIRTMIFGGEQSGLLVPLAIVYLLLSALWVFTKIV